MSVYDIWPVLGRRCKQLQSHLCMYFIAVILLSIPDSPRPAFRSHQKNIYDDVIPNNRSFSFELNQMTGVYHVCGMSRWSRRLLRHFLAPQAMMVWSDNYSLYGTSLAAFLVAAPNTTSCKDSGETSNHYGAVKQQWRVYLAGLLILTLFWKACYKVWAPLSHRISIPLFGVENCHDVVSLCVFELTDICTCFREHKTPRGTVPAVANLCTYMLMYL